MELSSNSPHSDISMPLMTAHINIARCAYCIFLQWKTDRWRGGMCPKLKRKIPGTRHACKHFKGE